jgi:DNA-binding CsgD family transcriptional regulator
VLDETGADAAARLRAGLVGASSLILSGRTTDGVALAEELVADASQHPVVMPTTLGMLRAVIAFGRLWQTGPPPIPTTDPAAAHHPAPPHLSPTNPPARNAAPFEWPLMRGIVAQLRGDHDVATTELSDAAVLQRVGKGLFDAEATAWLVVALCDAGAAADAETAMAQFPARHLAVVPGIEAWAGGVLACTRGDTGGGAALLRTAADRAQRSGAALVEARYLVELADRVPDERWVMGRLAAVAGSLDAPVLQCLCRLAIARVDGDLDAILDGAERLAGFGLEPRALAAVAHARHLARQRRDRMSARRAATLIRRVRGEPEPWSTNGSGPSATLTRREAEVAALAAGGFSDREIAARLFVSVRTVESHLARVYRKLGVGSRTQLAGALAPLGIAG